MKKTKVFKNCMTCSIALILVGCVAPPSFNPIGLKEGARGITTVKSTPYGCTVLGDVEGVDGKYKGSRYPSYIEAQRGAMNDLRNNALEVVGHNRRITLLITKETPICIEQNCQSLRSKQDKVLGYKINAQVFECGQKN